MYFTNILFWITSPFAPSHADIPERFKSSEHHFLLSIFPQDVFFSFLLKQINMFTRDKSQLLNEEHSRMGNNTYFCYNPRNKQALLSSRSQDFIQTANRSRKLHTCKTWHAVQNQYWNHQYLNFSPVWKECPRNLTALQNTTVLTIPRIVIT